MNECGCTTQTEQSYHRCKETPPYHFGKHECVCGYKWANE